MNAARLTMSYALLAQFLVLPEGAQIRGIRGDSIRRDRFQILIEHPELPELEEGFVPPNLDVTYTRSKEGIVEFESWGIKT